MEFMYINIERTVCLMDRKYGIIPILFVLFAVLIFSTRNNYASTLDLLGTGWNQSTVTVMIQDEDYISDDVIEDIAEALDDWNDALLEVEGGPVLILVSGEKRADIVIVIDNEGGEILGQTRTRSIGRRGSVLMSTVIRLNGEVFGKEFSGAGIRNVARHEFGHALGLGHSDDPSDLMFPVFECQDVFDDYDVMISDYDLDGLDAIYPLHKRFPLPEVLFWEE
jgi:predicted Zn-dependent protease